MIVSVMVKQKHKIFAAAVLAASLSFAGISAKADSTAFSVIKLPTQSSHALKVGQTSLELKQARPKPTTEPKAPIKAASPAPTPVQTPAPASNIVAGLDLDQTTGLVDITALANYMASLPTQSGFTAADWAQVITAESGGQVDVWNGSGTPCYGVFQEWGVAQGTSLGEQIQIAAEKPASAWAATI